jgi:hypothetical protein
MQQTMGVEGIVNTPIGPHPERETQRLTALPNLFAVARHLDGVDAVLAHQMRVDVLARGRHVGIELERLKVQLHRHRIAYPLHRLLQCTQTNGAPRADNIGNKIDANRNGHDHARCGVLCDRSSVAEFRAGKPGVDARRYQRQCGLYRVPAPWPQSPQ